jgi:ankyrin repeat protein
MYVRVFLVSIAAFITAVGSGCWKSDFSDLRSAVSRSDTNMLVTFIRSGGKPEVKIPTLGQRGYENLIHIAAAEGKSSVLETLLGLGADVNATNSSGESALMKVINSGDDEGQRSAFMFLLRRHANISSKDCHGRDALMQASAHGECDYVRLLLQAGADPNSRDNDLNTPLHNARTADIAVLLLAAGARRDVTNRNGLTPLNAAQSNPSARGVALELQRRGVER